MVCYPFGMNYTEAILLGSIQGITEFLPISSSGHLIAARSVFGIAIPEAIAFDVLVHVSTLAAIMVYFWRDIVRLIREAGIWCCGRTGSLADRRMLTAILVGTVPAALAGFFLEDLIEATVRSPMVVVFALLTGSGIFVLAERIGRSDDRITTGRGLLIGLFQVLALIPGTSRAGITIAGGLFAGLSRVAAARFSFLLGMPIIAGAGLKTALVTEPTAFLAPSMLAGAVTAFVVGIAAIYVLMRFLQQYGLTAFVVYRVAVAVLLFIFLI